MLFIIKNNICKIRKFYIYNYVGFFSIFYKKNIWEYSIIKEFNFIEHTILRHLSFDYTEFGLDIINGIHSEKTEADSNNEIFSNRKVKTDSNISIKINEIK